MSFLTLILKNLFRNKIRTLLTSLGITIGITVIIVMGLLTLGMAENVGEIITTGEADFIIAQANAADFILSVVSQDKVKEIEEMEEIEKAVGVLMELAPISQNPYYPMYGIEREIVEETKLSGINILEGRCFKEKAENELILGKVSATNLEKEVGDKLVLAEKEFEIVGIYETGNPWQDAGSFVALEPLQEWREKEGKLSMILAKMIPGQDINKVTEKIEENSAGELVTVKEVSEFEKVDKGFQFMGAATWAISLLAIIIGGIGVMNTMVMSVFERTREVGVLRAVGWKRSRVLMLILGESLIICILALVLGTFLGIGVVRLIYLAPAMQMFTKPVYYSLDTLLTAWAVTLGVGIIGGIYPAIRASRLSPLEALRYE